MELLEGVIAFFLLKAANMSEDSVKLAMATAILKYKDMRETILKFLECLVYIQLPRVNLQ